MIELCISPFNYKTLRKPLTQLLLLTQEQLVTPLTLVSFHLEFSNCLKYPHLSSPIVLMEHLTTREPFVGQQLSPSLPGLSLTQSNSWSFIYLTPRLSLACPGSRNKTPRSIGEHLPLIFAQKTYLSSLILKGLRGLFMSALPQMNSSMNR